MQFHLRQAKKWCFEKLYEINVRRERVTSWNYRKKLNKPQERKKKRCYGFIVILRIMKVTRFRNIYKGMPHLTIVSVDSVSSFPLGGIQSRRRAWSRLKTRDKILRDGAGTISFSATIRPATPVYTVKNLENARRVVSSPFDRVKWKFNFLFSPRILGDQSTIFITWQF